MPARPQFPPSFPRRPRRGSVVLFVLGVILLTAFLLTRLIERAGTELLAETKSAGRGTLRDEAYSALEVSLAVLADASANDGGLHAPQQGWGDPLVYAGYEPPAGFGITVTFEDETGKLSLASTGEVELEQYLGTIGATAIEAERLTDALMVWTKADFLPASSEADPRTYESSALPYAPPFRAIRSFDELRAIAVVRELFFDEDGRWTELGEKFRTDASLHSFNRVNVNSARLSVLMALGVEPAQAGLVADEMALGRDPTREPKFYRTINEAAAVHGATLAQSTLGADVQCLRVHVAVQRGFHVFHLEAVVQPGGGGGAAPAAAPPTDPNARPPTPVDPRAITRKSIDYPFRILELRETDGPVQ